MKFLICLLLVVPNVYAAKSTKWKPKYQQKKIGSEEKISTQEVVKTNSKVDPLEKLYAKKPKSKNHLSQLKNETLKLKQKAVPTLLKVIKDKSFPNENRWVAIYMLGRIMGKKSAEYIAKLTRHPNWMLRLASLKVLLHLNQDQYRGIYARLLEDNSLIVRHQALQNIKAMKIKDLAPYVWKMLYNKDNYVGMKGKRKRNDIIRDAIRTVGDLGFDKAQKPMLKMMGNKKYSDVHEELDYSLSKLAGPSPDGSLAVKKKYWNAFAVKNTTIL